MKCDNTTPSVNDMTENRGYCPESDRSTSYRNAVNIHFTVFVGQLFGPRTLLCRRDLE